jgi:hypothetical protein
LGLSCVLQGFGCGVQVYTGTGQTLTTRLYSNGPSSFLPPGKTVAGTVAGADGAVDAQVVTSVSLMSWGGATTVTQVELQEMGSVWKNAHS